MTEVHQMGEQEREKDIYRLRIMTYQSIVLMELILILIQKMKTKEFF